jgi:hypothetical protein
LYQERDSQLILKELAVDLLSTGIEHCPTLRHFVIGRGAHLPDFVRHPFPAPASNQPGVLGYETF